MKPFRIALNAQLSPSSEVGGVVQFVSSLVRALGQLEGPEEYIVVGPAEDAEWLRPVLGKNQRLVRGAPRGIVQRVKSNLGPLRAPARFLRNHIRRSTAKLIGYSSSPAVPESNGFFESLGVDLIHFPYQTYVRSSLPAIYNPHDLQHLHYPEFFSPELRAWREVIYRAGCAEARVVAAESCWVKEDLVQHYAVEPSKIQVIYRGSPTEFYEPIDESLVRQAKARFALPDEFILYPAVTWQHKNHRRLLEALVLLKRDGLVINLICTGGQTEYARELKQAVRRDGLEKQVRFLGFVSSNDLRALYRLAKFVIIPTLFEGGGFPLLEAFREGVPVACSSIPPLLEYGGDAALGFDATSVEDIAMALRRMMTDAELRDSLRVRGLQRIRQFSWERTAKAYRALYRSVAGFSLSTEDRALLGAT